MSSDIKPSVFPGYRASFSFRDIKFRVRNAPTLEYEAIFCDILARANVDQSIESLIFGNPFPIETEEQDLQRSLVRAFLNLCRSENYFFFRDSFLALLEWEQDGEWERVATDRGNGPLFKKLQTRLRMMDLTVLSARVFRITYSDFFGDLEHAMEQAREAEPEDTSKPGATARLDLNRYFLGSD